MNFYTDSPEWQYMFKSAIDWDEIIPMYYPSFPTDDGIESKEELIQFFEEMITATGDWTANSIAPRARELDEVGAGKVIDGETHPSEPLLASYKEATELSIFGLSAEKKYGGMELPLTVGMLSFTQLNRACISTANQIAFFTSIIDMIERFCDEDDQKRLIPKIIAGEISGSMCLTEPGAGSDVGSLTTSALKQEDGSYLLNGSKIFITNGGGGLGFVLARVKGAPEGLNGISLFLTEQKLEGTEGLNYKVVKTEDKMGLHGSFTCEVLYENTKAKLIGKENQGFRYMLHLMNEARVGVGLQALGGLESCIHYAREYAETREQFGKPIAQLPLLKRNLESYETERDAFRALITDTLVSYDIYQRLDMKKRHGGDLTQQEEDKLVMASKKVRRRTPLVKYYGTEAFTTISKKVIQVLGGYGFMKEYDAERWHRDSFAPLLYEGTSQIQALMALKDLMKFLMRNPTKYFKTMASANPVANIFSGLSKYDKDFQNTQFEFKRNLTKLVVKTLKPEVDYGDLSEIGSFFKASNWMKEESFEKLMVHAETICQALSYIETLRVLSSHADRDESRVELFEKYRKLVNPRFQMIFADWKNY